MQNIIFFGYLDYYFYKFMLFYIGKLVFIGDKIKLWGNIQFMFIIVVGKNYVLWIEEGGNVDVIFQFC